MFLDNTIVHSFQVKGSVLCRQYCQVCFLEQFSMQEKPSNTSHISDHLNSIPAVLKMSTDQTFKTTLKHQILTCYINVFCSRLINTPLTALGLLSLHGNCWNSHQGLHRKLRVKCYTKTPIKWSTKHLIQKDVLCSPKVLDHGGNLIPCVINYEVILI